VTLPSPPHVTAAAVQARLSETLSPLQLMVRDDSAAHAGHAGAREGSHLSVTIVSERFAGLGRVARHRLVYDSLRSLMPQGIHALAIDARAPGEP
jgi:BolA family transcriptional regulator, general stress-responsive regulator